MSYHLRLIVNERLVYSTDVSSLLEIGRQRTGESDDPNVRPEEGIQRLVVAPLSEQSIGRRQLVLNPLSDEEIEVENVSETVQLKVRRIWDDEREDLIPLPTLNKGTFRLPISISLNQERTLVLQKIDLSHSLEGLTEVSQAPQTIVNRGELSSAIEKEASHRLTDDPESGSSHSFLSGNIGRLRDDPQSEFLVVALKNVINVFQTASTMDQLFFSAAEGAYSVLNLDTARILSCQDGKWSEELTFPERKTRSISPASTNVLRRLLQERRTFWDEDRKLDRSHSLQNVEAVMAAPILSPDGVVIGALYGDRQVQKGHADFRSTLTSLDARVLELLASGISSGLLRQHQEEEKLRVEKEKLQIQREKVQVEEENKRITEQFELFFSPKLADELRKNPNLLEGRDAEVSILFCDIRGFSRVTERIGTSRTFEWIGDVMGVLSDCVLDFDGVVVDYIGDELMAMWGAPQAQQNHRELACRAAREMLDRLPSMNVRWHADLGETMDLGIGINSGIVKVGNSGSYRKFKYSPLGNAVNLASRVQGATKHLGVQLVVTGETASGLPPEMLVRQLCDVKVVNLDNPVRLAEILPPSTPRALIDGYALALRAFENREFRSAASHTGKLIEAFPQDGPSLVLLSRIVEALMSGPRDEHPVWKLPSK